MITNTIRFAWRWSLLVTVPVGCLFILWLIRTGTAFYDLGVKYESFGNEVNLTSLAEYEASTLGREIELAVRPGQMSARRRLTPIQIYIPEQSEASLNSDLPHSGKKYMPGSMIYPDGKLRNVSLRYRGDHYWHWAGHKKSFRIKTKKKSLYERIRAVNLSAPKQPDQISGYMSYFLAEQFDLISPRAEMVDVYVNGEYRGVHLFLEQLEEMVIRKHGKMPGDVYGADLIRKDAWRGLSTRAFENTGAWEKVAINNHFVPLESEAIERLIAAISEAPSPERSATIRSLIDVDAFGRFAAFRILCQTEHYDESHNWRLYYDPWRNQLQPIVWDPVGWAEGWVPPEGMWPRPDIVSSIFDEALMQDNVFLVARQRALEDYYTAGKHEELVAEVDRMIELTGPSIDSDPALTYRIKSVSADEALRAQAKFRKDVDRIASSVRQIALGPAKLEYISGNAEAPAHRIAVSGRRPLAGLVLDLERPARGVIGAALVYLTPGGMQSVDVSGAVSQIGQALRIDAELVARYIPLDASNTPAYLSPPYGVEPGHYAISLTGEHAGEIEVAVINGFFANGEIVRGQRVETMVPKPFVHTQTVALAQPLPATITWEGSLEFDGVTHISDNVVILPGTTLKMGKGASIIFEGRVLANGTADQPIRVVPRDADPWGVLALRGKGADRSELAYCNLSNGSGLKTPMAEYSAMLSIHDVDEILVRGCVFEDSQVVDDMVHAVYSSVEFEDCTFVRSLFDALDLDITTGTVQNCRFIESGNDALDLMTSTILVRDCEIAGSVDKGVSVGEDTEAMIQNTKILGCKIGVQIKDRSRAVVYNCDLVGNETGIDAYKKNWRYDSGGFGFIYKSFFSDNKIVMSADKHSRFQVHDSTFDVLPKESKRIKLDELTSTEGGRTARYPALMRFPEEQAVASPKLQGAWLIVDPKRRGAAVGQ